MDGTDDITRRGHVRVELLFFVLPPSIDDCIPVGPLPGMGNMDTVSGLDELVHASEEQIRGLRKEIERLQNDIANMKTRRNMYTSRLVQLPAELIARVLFFSQCSRTPCGLYGAVETPWIDFDLRWTQYMLVCRRLREVGIGSPQLWSFICYPGYPDDTSMTQMALYLDRAKDCPLDLCGAGFSLRGWDGDPDTPRPTTSDIRQCLQTARRIYVPQPAREKSTESSGSFVEQEMPRVEALHCSPSNQSCHNFSCHFLGGSSHILRSLTLHNVLFSGTTEAPELPALVYLDVHISKHEEPQHLLQLASLLRNTPSLQTLAIACNTTPVAHTGSQVSLPHLHTLKLSGLHANLLDVIRLLYIPSHRLYINFKYVERVDAVVRDFVLSFWAAATGSSRLPDGRLIRGRWSEYTLSFGSEFDFTPSVGYPSPCLYYIIMRIDSLLGMGMPLESVTTMVYNKRAPNTLDAALPILGSSLQHVILDGVLVDGVFQDQLIDYLRERVAARCPVASIRCLNYKDGAGHSQIKGFAEALTREDLAGSVSWT